jgi:GNAT superfamily N-acetyltransferase
VLDLVSVRAEFEKDRCRPGIAADAINAAGMRGCPLRVSGGMPSNGGGKIRSPVGAMKSTLKFLWDGLSAESCGVENQQGPHDTQQQTQGERLQASAHGAHPSGAGPALNPRCEGRISDSCGQSPALLMCPALIEVREIQIGDTSEAVAAMLELRPRWGTAAAILDFIDVSLRPAGYRLVGAFNGQDSDALAVAGFREVRSLAWGHYLYVDDLSTVPGARRAGHGERLMDWLTEEAQRLGCEGLHLDSGVGADRVPAHRLYMRHGLRISAHHFERPI